MSLIYAPATPFQTNCHISVESLMNFKGESRWKKGAALLFSSKLCVGSKNKTFSFELLQRSVAIYALNYSFRASGVRNDI